MVPGRDICLMGETYVTDLTSGGGVDHRLDSVRSGCGAPTLTWYDAECACVHAQVARTEYVVAGWVLGSLDCDL